MTRDRIVREGIRVVAMVVVAVDIVEQTAPMFAQGVIEYEHRVSLRIADQFRLLEQIRDAPVIDTVLEPRCVREKAGQIGFVRALQDTAGDIRQTFVIQDDQTCQVVLEMAKLASILKEIAKDVRVGGIRVRWDSWVSVIYSKELNSSKSSVTLQRIDRHGILGQKLSDFQVSV
jgi:hypothetical protein